MSKLAVRWIFRLGVGLSVLACLFVVFRGVASMEATYRKGQIFYLAIRPADPRSLLQGDYMALAYEADTSEADAPQRARFAVLSLDARGIATFAELAVNLEELGPQQVALPVQQWGSRYLIQPRSFLFQEGQGAALANARYAVFRYRDPRAPLLYGLANADLESLSHR